MNNQQQFGPWTVEKRIKRGRVFFVSRENDDSRYVLKTVYPNNYRSSSISKAKNETLQANKIRNEIKVLKRLTDHPNIITLVDYDSEAQTPWHVTEYCSGGPPLHHATRGEEHFENWSLEDLHPSNLNPKIDELAKALGYIHSQGISLGSDIEIFLTADKQFVIGDIEEASICPNHYVDTTGDLKAYARCSGLIEANAKAARKRKTKEREINRDS